MIPVHSIRTSLTNSQGFRPESDTLAALRRALNSYPEILALSCRWMYSLKSTDDAKSIEEQLTLDQIPLGVAEASMPGARSANRLRIDYNVLKEELGRPIALILYAREYIPASRLRHLNLYMKRLFPSYQSSPVCPAVSACSDRTLLARIYGFEPVSGPDPASSVATLQAPVDESRLDRLAG